MNNSARLNRIGEATLTEAQRRKVRRLARAEALTAEKIASVLNLNVDVVEAELTERERRSIDQEAGWRKVRTEQKFLSDEQWDELFAKRDRQSIILACIPLIDFYNKTSPDYVKQEIAS
jgi:hypothetical protein